MENRILKVFFIVQGSTGARLFVRTGNERVACLRMTEGSGAVLQVLTDHKYL